MGAREMALFIVGALSAIQASAYDWPDNHHACIVEHARYLVSGEDRYGPWDNAPKTFFVRIRNCVDYAKDKGVPFARLDVSSPIFSIESLRVDRCAETEFRAGDNVIEFDGLDMQFLDPVADIPLVSFPVANDTGTVKFRSEGQIDYGTYGALSDGETPAWFVLSARCTVLKP